jgi:hypothetical protein
MLRVSVLPFPLKTVKQDRRRGTYRKMVIVCNPSDRLKNIVGSVEHLLRQSPSRPKQEE